MNLSKVQKYRFGLQDISPNFLLNSVVLQNDLNIFKQILYMKSQQKMIQLLKIFVIFRFPSGAFLAREN